MLKMPIIDIISDTYCCLIHCMLILMFDPVFNCNLALIE